MSDDMRNIFGKALEGSEPAASLSADSLVAAGRRKRRQRGVGAATAGVAVVAALAIALPMAWGQGSATPAANGGEMPELDSNKVYMWDEPIKTDTTTGSEKYGDAFWGWFDQNVDGYEYTSDDKLKEEGKISSEPPTFKRQQTPFLSADADDVENSDSPIDELDSDPKHDDYERPSYSLPKPAAEMEDGGQASHGPPALRLPGSKITDSVKADVYPKGQYTKGTKAPLPYAPSKADGFYDVINCEGGTGQAPGYEAEMEYDVDCQEGESSDGGRVVEATEEVTRDGVAVGKSHVLAVYRADGSALVLRDQVADELSGGDEPVKPEDLKPGLDFDQLTDLAQSLPNDPVK